MPKDQEYWEQNPSASPGVDEAVFHEFESRHSIEFPTFLKEMYRVQNGGPLRFSGDPAGLLPLKSLVDSNSITSLDEYLTRTTPNPLEILYSKTIAKMTGRMGGAASHIDQWREFVRRRFKSQERVFVIAQTDGNALIALDFNAGKPKDQTPVVEVNFSNMEKTTLDSSFEKWVKKITKAPQKLAIDWGEIDQLEILCHSSMQFPLFLDGSGVLIIESVFCLQEDGSHVLFKRTSQDEKIIEITRIALPKSILIDSLEIDDQPFRHVNCSRLVMKFAEENSWVVSTRKSPYRWETIRSRKNCSLSHIGIDDCDADRLRDLMHLLRNRKSTEPN